ncbi:hypothetical protein [Streptomyces sp. ST2-7A]|uniref:hypothetical protein n=1 Tax=Streptomyces sp. ST2-7A TaxID=2907214 RepID=UPI001F1AB0C9|nr:hypothetical protein [Streptomyces sp. ST2-7A]MCE7082174.1 hypothetical protein [Streptomyces sp. ST2-7A]
MDQVLFRWGGNHGIPRTGMGPVAASCSREAAERLGAHISPLLWVPDNHEGRRSFVRITTPEGNVALIARRPHTDGAGRPSTESLVLTGSADVLTTPVCLGLTRRLARTPVDAEGGGWGALPLLSADRVIAFGSTFREDLSAELHRVGDALAAVTATWLRDPARRVSLLVDDSRSLLPDHESVPVLYLGLHLLFGTWRGRPWTFATHDTTDTHPLDLTCVPRWEAGQGGADAPARLDGAQPPGNGSEHESARRLVEEMLRNVGKRSATPALDTWLPRSTDMGWPDRCEWLERRLRGGARGDARPIRRSPAEQEPVPPEGRATPRRADGAGYTGPGPSRADTPGPGAAPTRHRAGEPPARPRPDHAGRHAGWDAPASHLPGGSTVYDGRAPHAPYEGHAPHDRADPHDPEDRADRLHLEELGRAHDMSRQEVNERLDRLADATRAEIRGPRARHEVCGQVLRLLPRLLEGAGDGHERWGRGEEDIRRLADLFTRTVAPLARDDRYRHDLDVLFRAALDAPDHVADPWLRHAVLEPVTGRPPDLPPEAWRRVVRHLADRPVRRTPDLPRQPPAPPPPSPSPLPSPPSPMPTTGGRPSEAGETGARPRVDPAWLVLGGGGAAILAIVVLIVLIASLR